MTWGFKHGVGNWPQGIDEVTAEVGCYDLRAAPSTV